MRTLTAPQPTFDKPLPDVLAGCLITLKDQIVRPPACLAVIKNGVEYQICTKGNISMLIGKAKQGKTFAISLMVAAALSVGPFQGLLTSTFPNENKEIIFIDTEQGDFDTQAVLQRICDLLGVPQPPNLKVYNLRAFNPSERLALVEECIYSTTNLGMVVIDGIRDLVNSINDEEQAVMISSKLLKWSADLDIHIMTVLHMNKGREDNNARGHLGTELTNKCETVISVSRSGEEAVVVMKPEYTRGKDFDPIAFFVDNKGIPQLIPSWKPKSGGDGGSTKKSIYPEDYDTTVHLEVIKMVFANNAPFQRNKLERAVKKAVMGICNLDIGLNKAGDWILHWETERLITVTGKRKTPAVRYAANPE